MKHRILLVCLCAFSCCADNSRPILGVLTQPLNSEISNSSNSSFQYVAASYVKFIEQAGARAVPVFYNESEANLAALFQQINGILFPGGGASLTNTTEYARKGKYLYDLAIRANDEGDYFPIWGTCLGFQQLVLNTAGDDRVLCRGCFAAEGTPLPLDFTAEAKASSLFKGASEHLLSALASKNITENSHHSGIRPEEFVANTKLREFYHVLSTNADEHGNQFASTIEAKAYPVTATQWHPEKNNFEWGLKLGPNAIPHSPDAILTSQFMANHFVGQARKNAHKFSSRSAEEATLIYNYSPIADPDGYFDQIYMWPSH